MPRPPDAKSPAPRVGGNGAKGTDRAGAAINRKSSRSANRSQQAFIPLGPIRRLEVSVREWRGAKSLELRESSAIAAGSIFICSGKPLTLPIELLPELIKALQSLVRE